MVKKIAILSAICLATGTLAGQASAQQRFPFRSYERRLAAETDIAGARRDFKVRLPIGRPLSEYEKVFTDEGGKCAAIQDKDSPNTKICTYSHGFIVQSVWTAFVTFDPVTNKSTDLKLFFWLEGP